MNAWERYANEPDSLYILAILLRQEMERTGSMAVWCRREIAAIEARLEQLATEVA